jgi:hypothetical protein
LHSYGNPASPFTENEATMSGSQAAGSVCQGILCFLRTIWILAFTGIIEPRTKPCDAARDYFDPANQQLATAGV